MMSFGLLVNEKHWHGATPATAMTHIAIQEALDGKVARVDGEGERGGCTKEVDSWWLRGES